MICNKCHLDKDLTHFYPRSSSRKGYRGDCKECHTLLSQVYYKEHKEVHDLAAKKYSLRINYKLSLEAYNQLGESQNWLCPICLLRKAEAVDHDHNCCNSKRSCGKCVRALLCKQCNVGMGLLKDAPEVLRRAACYVEEFRRR